MTGPLRAWIDGRADGVPPSLLGRMRRAADEVDARGGAAAHDVSGATQDGGADSDGGLLHMDLAAAALSCLREAAATGDDRAAALHLLAADALITDACEVAAASGALDGLARTCASEPLAALVGVHGRPQTGGGGTA